MSLWDIVKVVFGSFAGSFHSSKPGRASQEQTQPEYEQPISAKYGPDDSNYRTIRFDPSFLRKPAGIIGLSALAIFGTWGLINLGKFSAQSIKERKKFNEPIVEEYRNGMVLSTSPTYDNRNNIIPDKSHFTYVHTQFDHGIAIDITNQCKIFPSRYDEKTKTNMRITNRAEWPAHIGPVNEFYNAMEYSQNRSPVEIKVHWIRGYEDEFQRNVLAGDVTYPKASPPSSKPSRQK